MNDSVCLIQMADEGRIYIEAEDADDAFAKIDARYPGQLDRATLTFTMMTRADVPEGAEVQ